MVECHERNENGPTREVFPAPGCLLLIFLSTAISFINGTWYVVYSRVEILQREKEMFHFILKESWNYSNQTTANNEFKIADKP